MTGFRFSYNVFGVDSAGEFARTCRQAERQGYDAVYAADHLGLASPFPLLVAAAGATDRLRVGTLVLNATWWNPALLAREIATTDVLTEGRLDVGLGAGHMKWEFDEAEVAWRPLGERMELAEATIDELTRQFALDGFEQQAGLREAFGIPALRPVQRIGFGGYGPPLIVGGTGDRALRLAARRADVVSIAGGLQVRGQPPGVMRLATAAEAEDRVRYVRDCAGTRADQLEWHVLTQLVIVTEDRNAVAQRLEQRYAMPAEEILRTPFVLLGTVEQIADQLLGNRARYVFTSYTVHGPYVDVFAPVIERIHAISS